MGKQNDTLGFGVTKWSVASADVPTGWPGPGKPFLSALPHPTCPLWGPPSGAFPSGFTWVEQPRAKPWTSSQR